MAAKKVVRRTAKKAAPAKASKKAAKSARKPAASKMNGAKGRIARPLPGAPRGKASSAPLAEGDLPVRAYIATLPHKQQAIVEAFDLLVGRTLPHAHRAIKWGMPFYGTDQGFFASCGAFADHVKVSFFNGTLLKPVPPVGTAKYVRGVDIVDVNEMNEAQLAKWIVQASKKPGLGAAKK